jgi:mannose-6-phosphate isomerase-like protein (cupin superfamily)
MRRRILIAALLLTAAAPLGAAQDTARDTNAFAAVADVRAQVAAMAAAMKPGQGFAWQPLLRDGDRVAALEYWKKPGRPAVHPDQAEYGTVIAGAGTLVMGGTLDHPTSVKPDLVEGDRIIGGTTRALAPGDVFLIPAGVPHWFGITGDRLVLLGTKLPSHP